MCVANMLNLDECVLSIVIRFCSCEERVMCLNRDWRQLVKDSMKQILEDCGILTNEENAYTVYRRLHQSIKMYKRKKGESLIDGKGMCSALDSLASLSLKKAISRESRLLRVVQGGSDSKIFFAGESWRLRLVTKRSIRIRNAQDSRFPIADCRPDDHQLAIELQLLPTARCYPNCNCRYTGQAHFALILNSNTLNTDLPILSIELTGCYSWRAIPTNWYSYIASPSIHLLAMIQCCTADWATWASLI